MPDGLVLVVNIEVGGELLLSKRAVVGEETGDRRGGVSAGARVDFRAVARGEDGRLGNAAVRGERRQRGADPRFGDGESLPQLDGGCTMVQSDDEEMHANAFARASSNRPTRIISS